MSRFSLSHLHSCSSCLRVSSSIIIGEQSTLFFRAAKRAFDQRPDQSVMSLSFMRRQTVRCMTIDMPFASHFSKPYCPADPLLYHHFKTPIL
jgi:hypothetical protein